MTIHITTPLPPSANHYKRPRRNGPGMFLTGDARRFIESVKKAGAGLTPYEKEKLRCEVQVFRGEKNGRLQRGDLENFLKVLMDALQGVAFRNDSQVARLEAEMFIDRERPRCEVLVEPYVQALDGFTPAVPSEPRKTRFGVATSATYRPGDRKP